MDSRLLHPGAFHQGGTIPDGTGDIIPVSQSVLRELSLSVQLGCRETQTLTKSMYFTTLQV